MGYALKLGGRVTPLTGMIDPKVLIEGRRNTIVYEQDEDVRAHIFKLFATNHSPQSGAGRVVRLRLLGPLARLAGRRETICVVPEGATVHDLLMTLAARYGPEFASALLRAPGELHTHVRVFVDGADADPHDPVAVGPAAAPEVTVLVMPIFEGGSR